MYLYIGPVTSMVKACESHYRHTPSITQILLLWSSLSKGFLRSRMGTCQRGAEALDEFHPCLLSIEVPHQLQDKNHISSPFDSNRVQLLFWYRLVFAAFIRMACHHPYKGRAVEWKPCPDEAGPNCTTSARFSTIAVQRFFCGLH